MAKKEYLGVDFVVNKPCMVAYPHLATPRENELKHKSEYSVMLCIPKADTAVLNIVKKAMAEAARKKFGPNVNLATLDMNRFRDGDGTKDDGTEYRGELKGHWLVNLATEAKAERRAPAVVSPDGHTVCDPDMVYSGCFCCVSVSANGWEFAGKKGVSLYLRNVQFVRDGEPFKGGYIDEFAPVEGGESQAEATTGFEGL